MTTETLEAEAPESTETDGHVALVIPVTGPLYEAKVPADTEGSLAKLYELTEARTIQAVPLPDHVLGSDRATAYIDEEGKLKSDWDQRINHRATDFMIGGLTYGDVIVGTFVLMGFHPEQGIHGELPSPVAERARLIEKEAG